MDGTVTTAAYDDYYGNYVVIEDSKGYCTKYAHMDTLSVSTGQDITHGTVIGTTGNTGSSTGSHLHIECLYNGEYYNPLFYFEAGEKTLYGETPGSGSGGGGAIPPDSYNDETVQALMEEAAKYLGYPYVWGGSSPSTSFDCSGFVCWVFTNSGVHNFQEPRHRAFMTSVLRFRQRTQRQEILSFYGYIQFRRCSQPCGNLLRKRCDDTCRRSD